MSALAYTLTDSATMLRRNLKHQLRYPSVTLQLVGHPVVFLLLFVYVFGGQLGAGLAAHQHGNRTAYLTYLGPGTLIMTVASAALGTALSSRKSSIAGWAELGMSAGRSASRECWRAVSHLPRLYQAPACRDRHASDLAGQTRPACSSSAEPGMIETAPRISEVASVDGTTIGYQTLGAGDGLW